MPAGTAKPSGSEPVAASARNARPAIRQACSNVRKRRSRERAHTRNRAEVNAAQIAMAGGVTTANPMATGGRSPGVWKTPANTATRTAAHHATETPTAGFRLLARGESE
jgi:hypothetical protein